MPGITAQVLTVQLRQLEADGVVAREAFAEVPVRVEYTLTELGRELSDAMDALERWGTRYQQAQKNGAMGVLIPESAGPAPIVSK